jgi:hypothetical protein
MEATSSTLPATATRANSARKALFALLRLAIGVGILVYLVKSAASTRIHSPEYFAPGR